MSLTSVVGHTRNLEHVADGLDQQRRAIAATSAILLTANEAGWHQTELAALLGMKRQRVTARIVAARRTYAGQHPAILIDEPLTRPSNVYEILQTPVAGRLWPSVGRGCATRRTEPATVRNWDRRGVLPNTGRRTPRTRLYLRTDLDRVRRGPFRGSLREYPDFDQLLEQIAAAVV